MRSGIFFSVAAASLVGLLGSLAFGQGFAGHSASVCSDPVSDPYVRFTTSVGNIDVELYQNCAPVTVNNFLGYVDRHDYLNSFLHRSVPNFVIQGGGYYYRNDNVETVFQRSPIGLELGVSNTRGTISMARLGGDVNSATSQWFFNLVDNPQLDTQGGGFAVFGKVVDNSSLTAMDAIASLQIYNAGSPFDALPVINYTSGPILVSNLVNVDVNRIDAPNTTSTVPGRVVGGDGRGLRSATVTLSDGAHRYLVLTSSLGYFTLDQIPPGNYTVSVTSKRYRFTSQHISLPGAVNLSFTGLE